MSRLYSVYGLTIESPFDLPGLDRARSAREPARHVQIQIGDPHPRFSGDTRESRLSTGDGEIIVRHGRARDLLLSAAVGAVHVSGDGSEVTCKGAGGPRFLRLLLDTGLGTAALCRGLEGLHAAAVRFDGRLLAIAAPTSAGKSSLTAALIQAGGELFTDDLLMLTGRGPAVRAHPGPALMNLPPQDAARVGRTLATLGGEAWVARERARLEPLALSEVVVLDRRTDGGKPRLMAESGPRALLEAALDSGREPERRRRRFELLARMARETRMSRLVAGEEATPAELAAVVRSSW
jgi:hypothetical protein